MPWQHVHLHPGQPVRVQSAGHDPRRLPPSLCNNPASAQSSSAAGPSLQAEAGTDLSMVHLNIMPPLGLGLGPEGLGLELGDGPP
jgi:hypothetical protein